MHARLSIVKSMREYVLSLQKVECISLQRRHIFTHLWEAGEEGVKLWLVLEAALLVKQE